MGSRCPVCAGHRDDPEARAIHAAHLNADLDRIEAAAAERKKRMPWLP